MNGTGITSMPLARIRAVASLSRAIRITRHPAAFAARPRTQKCDAKNQSSVNKKTRVRAGSPMPGRVSQLYANRYGGDEVKRKATLCKPTVAKTLLIWAVLVSASPARFTKNIFAQL